MRKSSLWWALLIGAVSSVQGAEQVTISEFMASNTSTLQDEDHLFADWIELRNSGTNAVNLDGWYLTDNDNNLTKWRIPATNIAAGALMVIFADSKDRSIPGRTLHTSFNLSASGEYLALVKPDGVTIATEFAPAFPGQAPNVSYGFTTFTTNSTVIASNSPVRWRIPVGTEGVNWTATNYNDSTWAAGTNGVGFGSLSSLTRTDVPAPMSNVKPSAYLPDGAWAPGTRGVVFGSLSSLPRTDVRAAMSNVNASAYIRHGGADIRARQR